MVPVVSKAFNQVAAGRIKELGRTLEILELHYASCP